VRLTTVYVVDDEVEIGSLLTRILSRDGLRVLPFRTAQAALTAMERDRPDLVVTDLMMPGLNGLELATRVKALVPDAAIVVMTGFASLENVVDALRSGVDDFVTKPFGAGEIRAVVQRVLTRRSDRDGAAEEARVAAQAPAAVAADAAPDPNVLLARRLRDMSLLESVHAMLGDDVDSRDLAGRCAAMLRDALGVTRAAIVVPGARDGVFRLNSATGTVGNGEREREHDASVLQLIRASATPANVEAFAIGDLAARLDRGPAAAAPLRPRDVGGPDAGVVLVSRAEGAPRFEGEDLRVLGVVSAAIGDVLHALRTAERAEEAYVQSLFDVVTATEHRAPWFLDHSMRVRDLSLQLAEHVGLPEAEIDTLRTAAPLLDLGRVHIGDEVLSKQGRLSTDEWRTLRSHPEIADALVRPLGRLRHVKPVIRHHHENWDGSGYPDGLRGEDIPYLAALVRITDAFAALTSPRPWRAPLSSADAVRRLVDFSGTHFHPQLVAAFAELQHGAAGDGVAAG
jgi:response regulator RpfG family c-di-GMP phosphodiesterase